MSPGTASRGQYCLDITFWLWYSRVAFDAYSGEATRERLIRMFAIHLCASNDLNGNARRCFLVFDREVPVACVDEGCAGRGALKRAGFEDCPVQASFQVPPAEYRSCLKFYPNRKVDIRSIV